MDIERARTSLERIRDFPYVGVKASHAIVSIAKDGIDALGVSPVFDAADILAAVRRERERCAKIAEDQATVGAGEIYIARKIADAIRTSDGEQTE